MGKFLVVEELVGLVFLSVLVVVVVVMFPIVELVQIVVVEHLAEVQIAIQIEVFVVVDSLAVDNLVVEGILVVVDTHNLVVEDNRID